MYKKNMIYFEAKAGLCNRLRGIASAHEFARRTNQDLTIIWPNNHDCNCNLNDLFDLEMQVRVKVMSVSYLPFLRARLLKERLIRKYYIGKSDFVLIDDDVYGDMDEMIQKSSRVENTYITSAAYWFLSEKPMAIFKPVSEIKERVNSVTKQFGDYCIGVHLRRTDHIHCIQMSKTERFIEEMEKAVLKCPNVRFYVASDDVNEKKIMKHLFGERVIMQDEIEFSREKPKGIINAVEDLYALAACNLIFASKGSSFSDTAAQINQVPMVVIE